MINLPCGLFIIKYNININDLIDFCIENKRKVDLLTDLKISLPENDWINKIDIINKQYDYIFIMDKIEDVSNYKHLCAKWIGYMLPITNNSIKYENINQLKNKIINIGFNSLIVPNVVNIIGKDMMVLLNNLQNKDEFSILTQLNSDQLIWSNIFRSCGFFNGKIKWETRELSSS